MEAILLSETSVLTTGTRCNIPENVIHQMPLCSLVKLKDLWMKKNDTSATTTLSDVAIYGSDIERLHTGYK
jgi:hypothetical protein